MQGYLTEFCQTYIYHTFHLIIFTHNKKAGIIYARVPY